MKKVEGIEYAEYVKGDKEKPNLYHIFNQIYELNVYLVIGQHKKVKKFFELGDRQLHDGFCFQSKTGIVIWLDQKGMFDTLAHECIHAISFICEMRGIEYDEENDEHIAFLMSWLVRSFYFAAN